MTKQWNTTYFYKAAEYTEQMQAGVISQSLPRYAMKKKESRSPLAYPHSKQRHS